jgi:hypothetical protein
VKVDVQVVCLPSSPPNRLLTVRLVYATADGNRETIVRALKHYYFIWIDLSDVAIL